MIALLTGPPGVGKSSVASVVALRHPLEVETVSFGQLIYDAVISRRGVAYSYDEFRANASTLVEHDDIMAATLAVVDLGAILGQKWLIVDSHAVSQTQYGWQAYPDTPRTLEIYSYDKVIHLHASPEIIMQRVSANPSGRHVSTAQHAKVLSEIQLSVSIYYSGIIGCVLEVIDASGELPGIADALENVLDLTSS